MPGSANFVGEFLILLGVFQSKLVIAIVAFVGVALAAVYTLRLYIRAMHNRVGPEVSPREMSAPRRPRARAARRGDPRARRLPAARAASAGARRRQRALAKRPRSSISAAAPTQRSTRRRRDSTDRASPAGSPSGADIDWAGALAAARAARRRVRRAARRPAARAASSASSVVPLLTLVALGAAIGLGIWQWDDATTST